MRQDFENKEKGRSRRRPERRGSGLKSFFSAVIKAALFTALFLCLLIVLCAAQFTGRIESRILGKINEAVTANETGRIAVEQAAVRFFSYNDGNMDSQSATYDPRGGATVQESKDDSTENGSFENNSTGNSTTGSISIESSGTGSSSTGNNSTGNNTTEENNKGLSGGSGTNKEEDKLSELLAEGYIAVEPADPDFISISFAGDILLDERYAIMAAMLQRSGGEVPAADTAFDEKLLSEMREADIFMLNNEFPYSDRGAPLQGKKYTFRARPEYCSILRDIGADIVSLANNHVNDYGQEAMTDTFEILKNAGIPFVGAGYDIDEASAPVRFTDGNTKIAVIAATQIERTAAPDTVAAGEDTPGVFRCLYDMDRLVKRIQESKDNGCFTIVYIHWGTESTEVIDEWQKKQGKQIAEAGADMIIGDHPHVLQRLDKIDGTPVIYSLGNYLFNSKTQDTCLLNIRIDTKTSMLSGIRMVPAIQSGCRTKAAEGAEAARILKSMQAISPSVVIDTETGEVSFPE